MKTDIFDQKHLASMRRTIAVLFLATAVQAFPEMASNFTFHDPAPSTLSCQGISTYDFEPSSTVYVTVDGEYTYAATMNGSVPAEIYYTPPPPCTSVILPSMSFSLYQPTSTENRTTSSLPLNSTSTPTVVTATISYEILTCSTSSTSTLNLNSTASHGRYTNSTTFLTTAAPGCSTTWSTYTTVYTASYALGKPQPLIPPEVSEAGSQSPRPSSSLARSTISASVVLSSAAARLTAVTVTVTKKTPVPATQIPQTASGGDSLQSIVFPDDPGNVGSIASNPGATTAPLQTATQGGSARPGSSNNGNNNGSPAAPTNSNGPANTAGSTPGIVFPSQSATNNGGTPSNSDNHNSNGSPATSGVAGGSGINNNNNGSPTTNGGPVGGSTNSGNGSPASAIATGSSGGSNNGLGSIINSAFNSPFTPVLVPVPVSTSLGAASATVNLVAGVPVQVASSSVYIGGSYVPLPTGTSTARVTIAGQTFTVVPSAVIAAGSTLSIARSQSISYSTEKVQVAALTASTVTQKGVIITIEPSAAIISGSTFAIGLGASSTTLIVAGQTITLGSSGVAFPSTTYLPAITTAPAYVITTIGSLTFSIDKSEAILSGTTFRIGAGALNSFTTTTIDGTAITFGPSGIVLPTTTIVPTEVSLTRTGASTSIRSTASAATRVVSDTAGATSSGNGGTSTQRPPSWLSSTACTAAILLGLSTLPLSLLL